MNDIVDIERSELDRIAKALELTRETTPATPASILIMEQLVGLDGDLEEFELRLGERHRELLSAAARCKALIDTVRQARAPSKGG